MRPALPVPWADPGNAQQEKPKPPLPTTASKRISSTSAPFAKNASRSLSSDRPVASCRAKNFFHSCGCCCWEFQFCPDQDMLGAQRTGSTLLEKRQHLMAAGGQVMKTSDFRLNTTVQQTANSKQHQRPCTSSKSAGWVPASS